MAVYERSYRGYDGDLTPEWSRFLVIPRYAFQQVFASKMFIVFLVLCALYPLFCAVAIYVPHNANFLKLFQVGNAQEMIEGVQETVFPVLFMSIQGMLSFLLVFFIAPALVSADMRNNGLALYLARPFTRWEYVAGKFAVLAILMSAITWVPGMLLFFFQSYMMGWSWFLQNVRIGAGMLIGWAIWIVVLSLLGLGISATVKWKPLARLGLFAVYIFGQPLGLMIDVLFGIELGRMLDIKDMIKTVWWGLYGVEPLLFNPFPVLLALVALAGFAGLSLLLLARRIRAYEVVR